jgi:type II secretion system protein L
MRRQIFIYINGEKINPEDDTLQVCWVVQEAEQMPGPVFYGDLKTAANHATGCRVVVFVSAVNILLTQVELPAMNKQRMARAIPFSLEEYVASDVEKLHFAIGDHFGEKTACAVVDKHDMDSWQQLLRNANIQADVLVSECFGVQYDEGVWNILINMAAGPNSKALIRNGEQSGFAMDLHNVAFIIKNALDNTEQEQLPRRVNITVCNDSLRRQTLIGSGQDELPTLQAGEFSADSDDTLVPEGRGGESGEIASFDVQAFERNINSMLAQIQNLCNEKGVEFSGNDSEQGYLHRLAQGFSDTAHINLLQGEYSRREQLEKLIRPWRAAMGLAAAWLLIQGGLLVAEFSHLSSMDKQLDQQLIAAYKQAFPDAKKVPKPKVQMELALKKLNQGGTSDKSWFELLSRAGEVISDTKSLTVHSIRYKDDKMDMDMEISDLASLDELKTRLTKQAEVNVEIVSASAKGGKVESRLQLQLGSKS